MENIDAEARRTAIKQLIEAMKRGVGRAEKYRISEEGKETKYDKLLLEADDRENFADVSGIFEQEISFEEKCAQIDKQQLFLDDLDILEEYFQCSILQKRDGAISILGKLGIEIDPGLEQYENSQLLGMVFGEDGGSLEEIPDWVLLEDEGFIAGFLESFSDSFKTFKEKYLSGDLKLDETQRAAKAECIRNAFKQDNVRLRKEKWRRMLGIGLPTHNSKKTDPVSRVMGE